VALEDRTVLTTLIVNPALPLSPTVFHTIQAAVNAANAAGGDTIQIAPATYTEQVMIGKSLTMTGTGPGVIIQVPNTLTPDPVMGLNAVVEVNNATVNMSALTIQGPAPQGVTINVGILVVNGATANVTNTTVTQIQNPTSLGNQTGNAIQIGGTRSIEEPATATITNDIISGYEKTGILVRGGSTATITGSTISGIGPTTATAQNGIQVDLGATATITGNTVIGNEYTGAGSGADLTTDTQLTGILIDNFAPFIPGGTITVSSNTIGGTATGAGNDIGIDSSDPEITIAISRNTLQGNRFEGVLLGDGTATVSNNTISGSNIGGAVVAFSGDTANANGTLTSNNITDSGNGGLSYPGAGILLLNQTGATTTAQATANFNRIVGNKAGEQYHGRRDRRDIELVGEQHRAEHDRQRHDLR
jgi:parallel beta-helix repeat protein